MAKKAAKNNNDSQDAVSATAAAMKPAVSRSKKHVKAQAVAVAAAVEGFVQSLVHPDAPSAPAPGHAPHAEPAKQQEAPEPVAAAAAPAPVTPEVTHQQVSVLAYEFFLERRGQNGSPAEDWLRAEQALKSGSASS